VSLSAGSQPQRNKAQWGLGKGSRELSHTHTHTHTGKSLDKKMSPRRVKLSLKSKIKNLTVRICGSASQTTEVQR
jgi:hypothetical protein